MDISYVVPNELSPQIRLIGYQLDHSHRSRSGHANDMPLYWYFLGFPKKKKTDVSLGPGEADSVRCSGLQGCQSETPSDGKIR